MKVGLCPFALVRCRSFCFITLINVHSVFIRNVNYKADTEVAGGVISEVCTLPPFMILFITAQSLEILFLIH